MMLNLSNVTYVRDASSVLTPETCTEWCKSQIAHVMRPEYTFMQVLLLILVSILLMFFVFDWFKEHYMRQ